MSHPHCFGDKQYTSNRDLYHHQIRRESDWFGRIYVCVNPPPHTHTQLDYPPPPLHYLPPPIYMMPGHLIGWNPSGLVGYMYLPLTKLINTHHARSYTNIGLVGNPSVLVGYLCHHSPSRRYQYT